MNHHLINRLNTLANGFYPSKYEVCREAAAEIKRLELEITDYKGLVVSSNDKYNEAADKIERLEKLMEQNNSKHMEVLGKLKETNDKYDKLIAENNRLDGKSLWLESQVKRLEEDVEAATKENKDLKDVLVEWYNAFDTVVKLNDEHIREKIRLKEELKKLNDNHCATVRQSVYQQDKLARLDEEVRRTALINKSPIGYETTHTKPEELFGNSGLRDQFAIAAMEGLISNGLHNSENIARLAYEQADAMLKARKT